MIPWGSRIVKVVIVTTGLPGSGKGVFASVAKEMGIPVIVMGDIVREETKRRGLELTPENVRRIAIELRKEEGPNAIAKRVVKKIIEELKDECVVVVDGCRSMVEVEEIRNVSRVLIVNISAPFEVRVRRIASRKRSDDTGNPEEVLRAREAMERSLGIEDVIKNADVTLENVGTLEEFKRKVKELLNRVLDESCK